MKKRILALVCMLALVVGVFAVTTVANAQTDSYLVGYSIKDMNPWADPENPDPTNVINIKLTGNGNDDERVCDGMVDDNGDGVIDTNDGLFTTCTAVTDPYGTTVLYITMDTLQGYPGGVTAVREAVVAALGADVISADHIMISGSHTHSGPNLYNIKGVEGAWGEYFDYIVSQMTAAAVEAYNDRAPATMTKGSIDAKESTAYLGYNSGEGYQMNFIRHYDITASNGTDTKSYVTGSNFGTSGKKVGASTGMSALSGYTVTASSHVAEADNTMHLLKFDFAEDSGKEPVVLVNWRAHPTTNSGSTTKTKVSSDYVNALRYNLQLAGYRAAFLQGAGGNTVINGLIETDWKAECDNVAKTNTYGKLLAEIALDCMDRKMTDALAAGEIRTLQFSFRGELHQDGEGLLAAANAVNDYYTANSAYPTFPYKHTHTDGNVYIINSKFHANQIITRSTVTSASYTTEEVDVVALGDAALFVTAPNELSDRYDIDGSLADEDNDWLKLVNDATYGTPFVISHANGSYGYIPNALNYTYNSDEYYQITGRGAEGDELLAVGSYEANTSRFARGSGEALIDTYVKMIGLINGACVKTAYCEACGAEVEWQPLYAENAGNQYLGTGHYYLLEDQLDGATSYQKMILAGETLCLDLNGHTTEINGRYLNIAAEGTVNIMDTTGGGKMISYSGENNVGGGLAAVKANATLNIYSGTLQFIRKDVSKNETSYGGVIDCSGTVNMYGGSLIGGELVVSSYYTTPSAANCRGGTVYVSATGQFNAYGGSVITGSVPEGGRGACVFLKATTSGMLLSGDAQVDEIYFDYNSGANLTVADAYSGTAALNFNSTNVTLSAGLDIGNASSADLTGSRLTCVNDSTYDVGVYGTELKLNQWTAGTVATYYGAQGVKHFTSLTAAAAVSGTDYVKLHKNETKAVTISKDTCLELNGYSVTGAVTVADGATLYGMDAQTDALDVADGNYGRLTSVTGNVAGAARNAAGDGAAYMKITEEDGVSFHRANMEITAMTLRASQAGVYYKSTFKTNDVAAAHVAQFGVALSVVAAPTAENLKEDCQCSVFTDFTAAQDTYTGTLLRWVMHAGNSASTNRANADMPVYGRAYMLTDEGQYVFGKAVSRSFREQVEGVDALWDTLTDTQKEEIRSLYMNNLFVMKSWNIPNIRAAFGTDSMDIPFDNLIR